MRRRVVGTVGAFVAILVVLSAFVLAIAALVDSPINVMDLRDGQCFDADFETDEIRAVKPLDCQSPHLAEVVGRGELNADHDRAYPADKALLDEADAVCRPSQAMIGSDFAIVPIPSNEAAWDATGGRVICVALAYGLVRTEGSAIVVEGSG